MAVFSVGARLARWKRLYYYGARYYAAWIGRFISIDPLAEKFPQLTPYNYAGNKPITHKDLHGLQSDGGDEPVENDKIRELNKSKPKKTEITEEIVDYFSKLGDAIGETLTTEDYGKEWERMKKDIKNIPTEAKGAVKEIVDYFSSLPKERF